MTSSWSPVQGQTVPFSFYFGGGGGTSEDIAQPFYQAGIVPSSLANGGHDNTRADAHRPGRRDERRAGDLGAGRHELPTASTARAATAAPRWPRRSSPRCRPTPSRPRATPSGFANPSLYALNNTTAFHDVTAHPAGQPQVLEGIHVSGSRPDGGVMYRAGQDTSLAAATGYDNATGLGSPADDYLAKISTVTPLQPPVTPPPANAPVVKRIFGGDRYGTAINVSQDLVPEGRLGLGRGPGDRRELPRRAVRRPAGRAEGRPAAADPVARPSTRTWSPRSTGCSRPAAGCTSWAA